MDLLTSLSAYIIPGFVAAFALAHASRGVDEAFVAEWAGAHGLTVTTGNRTMLAWSLHNARMLRTWGVLGGMWLPVAIAKAAGAEADDALWWAYVFTGHLVGALYAEVALRRPVRLGARSASRPWRISCVGFGKRTSCLWTPTI